MQQLESFPLFEEKDHRFIMLGWEEKEEGMAVQTNQYVVTSGKEIVDRKSTRLNSSHLR